MLKFNLAKFTIVLVSMLCMGNVMAACTVKPAGDINFNLPASFVINRDATVGTVLLNVSVASIPPAGTIACSGRGYVMDTMFSPQTQTSLQGVWATNVPGIGIKVIGSANNHTVPAPPDTYSWFSVNNTTNGSAWNAWGYQLIKTGPVTAGTLSFSGPVAATWVTEGSATVQAGSSALNYLHINGSSDIALGTCTVNTPSIVVAMPTLDASDMRGSPVGTTAHPSGFNIDLSCDAGVKVSYQIDAVSSTYSQTEGVLNNNAGDGMAEGVGIQILSGQVGSSSVMSLASKKLVAVTANDNELVSVPLVSRYYKTGADIRPGKMLVYAVFTMSYE